MDKLTMAHEMALKIAESGVSVDICAGLGWRYADAMQAEADKRKPSGLPDALQEEWQPDWSVAPDLFYWWAIDGFSGQAYWYRNKPFIDSEQKEWDIQIVNKDEYKVAPSFNYTGDWRDSLRKRPEMEVERNG